MEKLILNQHKRTAYDERNKEARKHLGHTIYIIKKSEHRHTLNGVCEMMDVICMDCNRQFKAYNWND